MSELIKIRELPGSDVLNAINCAYIAERFFKRSRTWFSQRLNNNVINTKPISFDPTELLKFRTALKVIAHDLTYFTNNIPNIPSDMSIKVYVVKDPLAIEYFQNDDIEGFKEYLASDDMLDFPDPVCFDTEAEALAFCSGIGYGMNERDTPNQYPLRSCEETDYPFIEAIENY